MMLCDICVLHHIRGDYHAVLHMSGSTNKRRVSEVKNKAILVYQNRLADVPEKANKQMGPSKQRTQNKLK